LCELEQSLIIISIFSPTAIKKFIVQNRRWLNSLLTIICFIVPCYGQDSGQLLDKSLNLFSPFTVTQYSTKNGLPENQVLDIIEGSDNKLIISTANGIVEFNGSEFKPFLSYREYKDHMYTKLTWLKKYNRLFGEEMDGTLYLLYPGYTLIDKAVATTFNNDSIYFIDYHGVIYGANAATLKFKKLFVTGIEGARLLHLEKGTFLIATHNELVQYSIRKHKKLTPLNLEVLKFRRNPFNKLLYIICTKEIYLLKDTMCERVANLSGYKQEPICADIAFPDSSEIWLSTNIGLYKFYPDYVDFFSEDNSLPSKALSALYFKNNSLFAGTNDKGLLKLQTKDCFSFEGKNVFKRGASIASIIKSKMGDIIVVENGGCLYKLNVASLEPYCDEEGYHSTITEIDCTLFVGTWGGGVKLIKNKKLIGCITNPNSLPNNMVPAIFQDSRKNIWIGTADGIGKGTKIKNIQPFLVNAIHAKIICFYELKNKNICVGGGGNVYILNTRDELITHLTINDGLQGREVRSFYEDDEGKLWMGTYDGGLYCYANEKLTCINKLQNSTLNIDAFCLAKDKFGYLNMTSNHGLWRIKEKDLNDFYYRKLDYLIPFYYGEETGMLNTEFNGGFQNNYYHSPLGHFYFPSLQGVVLTLPDQPDFIKLKPEINQLLVNDTLHTPAFNTLKRTTYSIEFDFSCVNYSTKNNVHYQYQLNDGHTRAWSALQKKQTVTFKMLPPGSYTFSVRALDAFNDRTPLSCSYSFIIEEYFYETLLFKLISLAILILLVSIFIRLRIQGFRKEAEDKERTKRQLAELELKAVQAQMNPHFIFNSLNTVKYHLSINDNARADLYLDYFSKLLRDFLEVGAQDFITLRREVKILTSYIELEKVRVHPTFDYSIHIYDDIENELIPTHLLQPLIENAIKHGINHSKNKCRLRIYFYKKDRSIVAVIFDDGIGRKKSAEINKNSQHPSLGTTMVLDKIRIVNELYGLQIILTIEDMVGEPQEPNGTIVQLIIPLKNDTNNNR
jgi:sensor histidine kinase YesM